MIRNGSIETTQELMKAVDVVVATGGGAMVKSAYSSGKPSFGVGAGNVPVIIDRDVDLKDAVEKIVTGASFDNGIICSHEQFVLAPEEQYDEIVKTFEATGKVWFTDDEAISPEAPRHRVSRRPPEQGRRRQVAAEIGAMAGIDVPETARIILLPAKGAGIDDVLAKEKLCPVVAILPYKDVRGGGGEGQGQPAGRRRRPLGGAALERRGAHPLAPASSCRSAAWSSTRPCALTAGGSLTNGFAPTTTLGCGSWGGNSISENLDYKHLMNVSRIGKVITNKKVPTDAEIWA